MLIFEQSSPGRRATAQAPLEAPAPDDIPEHLLRATSAHLPEVSELQVVRHYTRLSQRNFSIDTHYYPLGSCTMKYNPRAANQLALLRRRATARASWRAPSSCRRCCAR